MSLDNNPPFVAFPQLRLERPTVAIVGGGASGVLTAVQLLRRRAPVRIVLVEERPRLGRGVAYSTPCDAHLLNVPAVGMSAFPHEPNHFLLWAQARRSDVHAGSFLPRRLYGEYLEWCLDEEIAHARRRTPFTAVHGRVTALAAGPGGAGLAWPGAKPSGPRRSSWPSGTRPVRPWATRAPGRPRPGRPG